ncbi:hypothetical protein JW933_08925, partial [candidate division FCPU426 bacterium]|nr:hypothetical protein [candidate division FCPU426 bacterium]
AAKKAAEIAAKAAARPEEAKAAAPKRVRPAAREPKPVGSLEAKKQNLLRLKMVVETSEGPAEVIVITNGGDDRIAEQQFKEKIKDLFRQDGKTTVMAHPEEVRRGQFLGLLDAVREWQRKNGALDPDNVSVGIMMPGKGTRMSPFTQRAFGIKPFLPMLVRNNENKDWLAGAEASLYTWTLAAHELKRMGFRGMAWKWGDEPQISAQRMAQMDLDLSEADAVRFGSKVLVTEDLAQNKEWLYMDPETGEFKQVRRRDRKALLERLGIEDTAGAKAYVHIGSPAFSYVFLEAAEEAFGDLIEGWIDVDGYVFEALTQDKATWDAEAAKDKGLQELLLNFPDFYERVQRMKKIINAKRGRAEDAPLNIQVIDYGEDLYWGDIGQLAKVRQTLWAVNDRESDAGVFARQLAAIDKVKPDKWGNIVVGDSLVPQDGSVRNSVIIDTMIHGRADIDGAVMVKSEVGDVQAEQGAVVFGATVQTLTMGKNSYAHMSVGETVVVPEEFAHTSMPKNPQDMGQGMESWQADMRVDVGKGDNYNKPQWNNPDSFANKFAQMRQRDKMPADIEAAIEEKFRAPLVAAIRGTASEPADVLAGKDRLFETLWQGDRAAKEQAVEELAKLITPLTSLDDLKATIEGVKARIQQLRYAANNRQEEGMTNVEADRALTSVLSSVLAAAWMADEKRPSVSQKFLPYLNQLFAEEDADLALIRGLAEKRMVDSKKRMKQLAREQEANDSVQAANTEKMDQAIKVAREAVQLAGGITLAEAQEVLLTVGRGCNLHEVRLIAFKNLLKLAQKHRQQFQPYIQDALEALDQVIKAYRANPLAAMQYETVISTEKHVAPFEQIKAELAALQGQTAVQPAQAPATSALLEKARDIAQHNGMMPYVSLTPSEHQDMLLRRLNMTPEQFALLAEKERKRVRARAAKDTLDTLKKQGLKKLIHLSEIDVLRMDHDMFRYVMKMAESKVKLARIPKPGDGGTIRFGVATAMWNEINRIQPNLEYPGGNRNGERFVDTKVEQLDDLVAWNQNVDWTYYFLDDGKDPYKDTEIMEQETPLEGIEAAILGAGKGNVVITVKAGCTPEEIEEIRIAAAIGIERRAAAVPREIEQANEQAKKAVQAKKDEIKAHTIKYKLTVLFTGIAGISAVLVGAAGFFAILFAPQLVFLGAWASLGLVLGGALMVALPRLLRPLARYQAFAFLKHANTKETEKMEAELKELEEAAQKAGAKLKAAKAITVTIVEKGRPYSNDPAKKAAQQGPKILFTTDPRNSGRLVQNVIESRYAGRMNKDGEPQLRAVYIADLVNPDYGGLTKKGGGIKAALQLMIEEAAAKKRTIIPTYSDADISNNVTLMGGLVAPLADPVNSDLGMVYASRVGSEATVSGKSGMRNFMSKVFNLTVRSTLPLAGALDTQCGLKAYGPAIYKVIDNANMLRMEFETEVFLLMLLAGYRVQEFKSVWIDSPLETTVTKEDTPEFLLAIIKQRLLHVTAHDTGDVIGDGMFDRLSQNKAGVLGALAMGWIIAKKDHPKIVREFESLIGPALFDDRDHTKAKTWAEAELDKQNGWYSPPAEPIAADIADDKLREYLQDQGLRSGQVDEIMPKAAAIDRTDEKKFNAELKALLVKPKLLAPAYNQLEQHGLPPRRIAVVAEMVLKIDRKDKEKYDKQFAALMDLALRLHARVTEEGLPTEQADEVFEQGLHLDTKDAKRFEAGLRNLIAAQRPAAWVQDLQQRLERRTDLTPAQRAAVLSAARQQHDHLTSAEFKSFVAGLIREQQALYAQADNRQVIQSLTQGLRSGAEKYEQEEIAGLAAQLNQLTGSRASLTARELQALHAGIAAAKHPRALIFLAAAAAYLEQGQAKNQAVAQVKNALVSGLLRHPQYSQIRPFVDAHFMLAGQADAGTLELQAAGHQAMEFSGGKTLDLGSVQGVYARGKSRRIIGKILELGSKLGVHAGSRSSQTISKALQPLMSQEQAWTSREIDQAAGTLAQTVMALEQGKDTQAYRASALKTLATNHAVRIILGTCLGVALYFFGAQIALAGITLALSIGLGYYFFYGLTKKKLLSAFVLAGTIPVLGSFLFSSNFVEVIQAFSGGQLIYWLGAAVFMDILGVAGFKITQKIFAKAKLQGRIPMIGGAAAGLAAAFAGLKLYTGWFLNLEIIMNVVQHASRLPVFQVGVAQPLMLVVITALALYGFKLLYALRGERELRADIDGWKGAKTIVLENDAWYTDGELNATGAKIIARANQALEKQGITARIAAGTRGELNTLSPAAGLVLPQDLAGSKQDRAVLPALRLTKDAVRAGGISLQTANGSVYRGAQPLKPINQTAKTRDDKVSAMVAAIQDIVTEARATGRALVPAVSILYSADLQPGDRMYFISELQSRLQAAGLDLEVRWGQAEELEARLAAGSRPAQDGKIGYISLDQKQVTGRVYTPQTPAACTQAAVSFLARAKEAQAQETPAVQAETQARKTAAPPTLADIIRQAAAALPHARRASAIPVLGSILAILLMLANVAAARILAGSKTFEITATARQLRLARILHLPISAYRVAGQEALAGIQPILENRQQQQVDVVFNQQDWEKYVSYYMAGHNLASRRSAELDVLDLASANNIRLLIATGVSPSEADVKQRIEAVADLRQEWKQIHGQATCPLLLDFSALDAAAPYLSGLEEMARKQDAKGIKAAQRELNKKIAGLFDSAQDADGTRFVGRVRLHNQPLKLLDQHQARGLAVFDQAGVIDMHAFAGHVQQADDSLWQHASLAYHPLYLVAKLPWPAKWALALGVFLALAALATGLTLALGYYVIPAVLGAGIIGWIGNITFRGRTLGQIARAADYVFFNGEHQAVSRQRLKVISARKQEAQQRKMAYKSQVEYLESAKESGTKQVQEMLAALLSKPGLETRAGGYKFQQALDRLEKEKRVSVLARILLDMQYADQEGVWSAGYEGALLERVLAAIQKNPLYAKKLADVDLAQTATGGELAAILSGRLTTGTLPAFRAKDPGPGILHACQQHGAVFEITGEDGTILRYYITEVFNGYALGVNQRTGAVDRIVLCQSEAELAQARTMQAHFQRAGMPGLPEIRCMARSAKAAMKVPRADPTIKPKTETMHMQGAHLLVMSEPFGQSAGEYLAAGEQALRENREELDKLEARRDRLTGQADPLAPDVKSLRLEQAQRDELQQQQLALQQKQKAGMLTQAEQDRLAALPADIAKSGRRITRLVKKLQRTLKAQGAADDGDWEAALQRLEEELRQIYDQMGEAYADRDRMKKERLNTMLGLSRKFQAALHLYEIRGYDYQPSGDFSNVIITPEGEIVLADFFRAEQQAPEKFSFFKRLRTIFFDLQPTKQSQANILCQAAFMEHLLLGHDGRPVLDYDAHAYNDFVQEEITAAQARLDEARQDEAKLELEAGKTAAGHSGQLEARKQEIQARIQEAKNTIALMTGRTFHSAFNTNLRGYEDMIAQSRHSVDRLEEYAADRDIQNLGPVGKRMFGLGAVLGGISLVWIVVFAAAGAPVFFVASAVVLVASLAAFFFSARAPNKTAIAVGSGIALLASAVVIAVSLPEALALAGAALALMFLTMIHQEAVQSRKSGGFDYLTKQVVIGDEHELRYERLQRQKQRRRQYFGSVVQMGSDLNFMWREMSDMIKDQAELNEHATKEEVQAAIAKARKRLGKKPGEKIVLTISTTMSPNLGIYERMDLPKAVKLVDGILAQIPDYGWPAGAGNAARQLMVQGRIVPENMEAKLRYLDGLRQQPKKLEQLKILYEIQKWEADMRADLVAEELRKGISAERRTVSRLPLDAMGPGYREEDRRMVGKEEQGLLSLADQITSPGREGFTMEKRLQPSEIAKLHEMFKKIRGTQEGEDAFTAGEIRELKALWQGIQDSSLADAQSMEDLVYLLQVSERIPAAKTDIMAVIPALQQADAYVQQDLQMQMLRLAGDVDSLYQAVEQHLQSGLPVVLENPRLERLYAHLAKSGYFENMADSTAFTYAPKRLAYLRDVCRSVSERGRLDANAHELSGIMFRVNDMIDENANIKTGLGSKLGTGLVSDLSGFVDDEAEVVPGMRLGFQPGGKRIDIFKEMGRLGKSGGLSEYMRNTVIPLANEAGPDVEIRLLVNYGYYRYPKTMRMYSLCPERVNEHGVTFMPAMEHDNVSVVQTWDEQGPYYNFFRNLTESWKPGSNLEMHNMLFTNQGDKKQTGAVIGHLSRFFNSLVIGTPQMGGPEHHIPERIDLQATQEKAEAKEEIGTWGLNLLSNIALGGFVFLQPEYARAVADYNPWFNFQGRTRAIAHPLLEMADVPPAIDFSRVSM